jgi:hypothetical protein
LGQFDVTGNLEVALLPNIVFKLWSATGLYVGPRLYVGGELSLGDPSVAITAPNQGQSFLSSQSIPLNATVDGGIKLSLYTGLDLKAGIAGLELGVDSCRNPETARSETTPPTPCPSPTPCPLNPSIDENHIFTGELDSQGRGKGYHHRPGGIDQPSSNAKMIGEPTKPRNSFGVYEGKVQVFNPNTGQWVPKKFSGLSTFCPDSWSRNQVLEEVLFAFDDACPVNGGRWRGTAPSGFAIEGFYKLNTNKIETAYPLY